MDNGRRVEGEREQGEKEESGGGRVCVCVWMFWFRKLSESSQLTKRILPISRWELTRTTEKPT